MGKLFQNLVLWLLLAESALAFDWEVQRFSGRDYVGLDKVAAFYNLPDGVSPEGRTLSLAKGRRSLLVTLGSREVEINGVRYVLSFPILEKNGRYWMSRMDLGKTVEPAFRPERVPGLKAFNTVILDPGHGGHDCGAASRYEREKNFALDVARRVRDELRKAGIRVVMTRNSDKFVDLYDRAALANEKANSIFVSLHFNAAPNTVANGLEIFCVTPRGSPSTEYDELLVRDMVQEYGNANEVQSFILAHAIYHALQGGRLHMFDRGVKRARFAVLRLTKMPAILVEGGFLTHQGDALRVAGKKWRNAYARAIATGILEFRKLVEERKPPRLAADYRNGRPGETTTVAALPQPTPSASGLTLRALPGATEQK